MLLRRWWATVCLKPLSGVAETLICHIHSKKQKRYQAQESPECVMRSFSEGWQWINRLCPQGTHVLQEEPNKWITVQFGRCYEVVGSVRNTSWWPINKGPASARWGQESFVERMWPLELTVRGKSFSQVEEKKSCGGVKEHRTLSPRRGGAIMVCWGKIHSFLLPSTTPSYTGL